MLPKDRLPGVRAEPGARQLGPVRAASWANQWFGPKGRQRMWALLSDPGHADSFDHLGEAYVPLRRLVEQLARREYAGRVYAFKSMASFNLTTAPTHQEAAGHDRAGIEYDPDWSLFRVGYSECASASRDSRIRTRGTRVCEPQEIGEVIDGYVQSLLSPRQPAEAESSVVENVCILAMYAGMFAVLVFWMLLWMGLPVGHLAILSIGICATATSLLLMGWSLLPRWERPWWRRARGRRATVRMGRLVLLGSGIGFGAIGVVMMLGTLIGELPKRGVWALLGALAVGVALFLVGLRFDRRRVEAAWAIEDTQRNGGASLAEPGAAPDPARR
jgi:hypothetical protein